MEKWFAPTLQKLPLRTNRNVKVDLQITAFFASRACIVKNSLNNIRAII